MPNHVGLVAEALVAINRVNGDTSVEKEDTRASLKKILDHVEMLLAALGDE